MYTYAFQILKKYLTTAVPELKEIDWYFGQDAEDKNVGIYTAPGLFLEFDLVGELRAHGSRIQSGETNLTVHLVTENVHEGAKRMQKTAATDHMAIFDKVFKNLHGFSAKLSYLDEFALLVNTVADQRVFNSLSRNNVQMPTRYRKALLKSTQRFGGIFYDHAAIRTYTPATPALQINPQ